LGRPGWHIEDTAITEKFFGPQYDIHGGARDLIFPHHEAEIAQMEAISNKKPLARYWIHTGFLTVNAEKMSKSIGNFITIGDFLKENSSRVLRFFVLKSHYRSPINYDEKLIHQAKQELARIDEFTKKLQKKSEARSTKSETNTKFKIRKFQTFFYGTVDDDFNTPKAMAAIFDLITEGNSLIAQNKISRSDAKNILDFLKSVDEVFNFIFWPKPKQKIPDKILDLAKEREKYRKQNLWQKADEIRAEIKALGWQIEDTKEGPKTKKL